MAARGRSVAVGAALALALGLTVALAGGVASVAVAPSAQASPGQEVTTTAVVSFGGGAAATTVAPATAASTTVAAADAGEATTTNEQTSAGSTSENRVLTESRKLMATIAGLVLAALGLALLTVRYWRATRPVGADGHASVPMMGTEAALVAGTVGHAPPAAETAADVPLGDGIVTTGEVAAADHRRSDDDYEPMGTGEHERVVLSGRSNRPGRAARVAALGRTDAG